MPAYGIIPARLASTRLPRKLLLCATGKPLLQYAWEAACRATRLAGVIVATDSEEIAACVASFGGRAEMTGEHPSGTDRIAEVARRCLPDADILLNLQGDEPELPPAAIDACVEALADNPGADMATLAVPIRQRRQLDDPACVKVARAADGRALYFSRLPIPFSRDESPERLLPDRSPWLLHVGIYAYRRSSLLRLAQLPPSPLETLERLEQLRALEAGATIQVAVVEHAGEGIDTPEDYARFCARQRPPGGG